MLTRRWQMGLASVVLSVAAHGAVLSAEQPAEFAKGLELLRRGQYAQAVQVLSAELKASDRPIEQRARTFYFRAKAYAALKEDALARADLNIAVWLKKLPPAEATDAARLKTQLDAASPVPAPGVGITPVTSQPIEPVKTAPPATQAAAQPRAPSRVTTTTTAPPAPRPTQDAGQQRAAPAWSQASVEREPVEAKPVPYIRPSPAFEAAATSQQPQRPAVQTSTIVTGSLPPPKKEASAPVAPPAPTTRWQTNVAGQPSTTPQYRQPSTPPSQMAAAALPSAPKPVATPRPAPTAYAAAPAASASPVATSSAAEAALRTEPPPSAALALADQSKETIEPAPAPSQDGSSLPLVGWLFEKQSSPYDSEIARADDFQRRYIEKIRAYNQGARQRDSGAVNSQQ